MITFFAALAAGFFIRESWCYFRKENATDKMLDDIENMEVSSVSSERDGGDVITIANFFDGRLKLRSAPESKKWIPDLLLDGAFLKLNKSQRKRVERIVNKALIERISQISVDHLLTE